MIETCTLPGVVPLPGETVSQLPPLMVFVATVYEIAAPELVRFSVCAPGTAPALEENVSEDGLGTMEGAEDTVTVTGTLMGVVAPAGVILTEPL